MPSNNQNNSSLNLTEILSKLRPMPMLLLVSIFIISVSIGIIMGHTTNFLVQIFAGISGIVFIILLGMFLVAYIINHFNNNLNKTNNSKYSKPIREIVKIYKQDHGSHI